MKIYAYSICANKLDVPKAAIVAHHRAGACLRTADKAALGNAMKKAHEVYPEALGYYGHTASLCLISDEFVFYAAKALVGDLNVGSSDIVEGESK